MKFFQELQMGILGSSGMVNWESESYSGARDFVAVHFFAIFFPAVSLLLDRFLFEIGIEGILYVCCWFLLIFHICFALLGNKAFGLWGIHGSSCSNCHSPCLSYMFRFTGVGSVILALHDAANVFLEVGKMVKYSGFERIAGISFLLFVFFGLYFA